MHLGKPACFVRMPHLTRHAKATARARTTAIVDSSRGNVVARVLFWTGKPMSGSTCGTDIEWQTNNFDKGADESVILKQFAEAHSVILGRQENRKANWTCN